MERLSSRAAANCSGVRTSGSETLTRSFARKTCRLCRFSNLLFIAVLYADAVFRGFDPVAPPDDGSWVVVLPTREAAVLAKAGPPEHRAEYTAGERCEEAEFPFDLQAQRAYAFRHRAVGAPEPVFHGPQ